MKLKRPFLVLVAFAFVVGNVVAAVPTQRGNVAKRVAESACVSAPVQVKDRVFTSKSLQRQMHYLAVLPAGYETSQKHYPVLYLLHGWAGDYKNWVSLTNLVADAEQYQIIIITPDAENSWYVNSATVPQDRFQDYIVKDLVAEVDSQWRTIAAPYARAVAGLSMGGYGAMVIALKHPGLFAVAGSISGALNAPNGIERTLPELQESLVRAFGPENSATRKENDVYSLAKQASGKKLPYLFVDCGNQDKLLPSNRQFVQLLADEHILYEYHEYPGAHSWQYWDHALPMLLKVVSSNLGQLSTPAKSY